MKESIQLDRNFFSQNTLSVARNLIGMRLVRLEAGKRISGLIIETEAYRGEMDLGCHAKTGMTQRNRVMYGVPGHAYIYFTYGMHWMLNIVTEEEGFPAAVLIRAIHLQEGDDIVKLRRGNQPGKNWCNGPGKICQALKITGVFNGVDCCESHSPLFVESNSGEPFLHFSVTTSPRVGLFKVPEPWKSIAWRFVARAENNLKLN